LLSFARVVPFVDQQIHGGDLSALLQKVGLQITTRNSTKAVGITAVHCEQLTLDQSQFAFTLFVPVHFIKWH
jgi:hypothetical protein